MRKKRSLFFVPLSITLLCSSLLFSGCTQQNSHEESQPSQKMNQEEKKEVTNILEEIQQMNLSENDFSEREVDIFSDISGDIPGETIPEKKKEISEKEKMENLLEEMDNFTLDTSFQNESFDPGPSF